MYTIRNTTWRQVSGPQSLALLNSDTLKASVLYPTVAGTYLFELSAEDSGGRKNSDQIQVIIQPAAQSMQRANVQESLNVVDWRYADQNQGILTLNQLDSVTLAEVDEQLINALASLNSAAELTLLFAEHSGAIYKPRSCCLINSRRSLFLSVWKATILVLVWNKAFYCRRI
nr:hypothetical protein [Vibrio mimicus]